MMWVYLNAFVVGCVPKFITRLALGIGCTGCTPAAVYVYAPCLEVDFLGLM